MTDDEARLLERLSIIEGRLTFEAKRNDDRHEQLLPAISGGLAKYVAFAIKPILGRLADLEAAQRQLNGRIQSLDGRHDRRRDTLAKLMEAREEREAGQAAIERELLKVRQEIAALRGPDGQAAIGADAIRAF